MPSDPAASSSDESFLAEVGREWRRFGARPVQVTPDVEIYQDDEETGSGIVRLRRAAEPALTRSEEGWLQETARRHAPRNTVARVLGSLRRALIGTPLQTAQRPHETLTKLKALAVLSSDALSSVAYGPEQVLVVLVLAGSVSLVYFMPIVGVILTVLAAVTISYRQTIRAYPGGGGSYIVAKDNLGTIPGLVAAAALMTDYILTVAVSISAGVDAVTSAYPALVPQTVLIGALVILLLVIGNLRGIRESASIFATPTYLFLAAMALMLSFGAFHYLFIGTAGIHRLALPPASESFNGFAGAFLVLRAFASGSASLTGVEAISDGVIAFKPVQWRNARTTLTVMSLLLGIMLLGTALLGHAFRLVPSPTGTPTLLSQLGVIAFGDGSPLYFFLQASTALLLMLAANTAFSDFPRLLFFMARDGYAPRLFTNLGERLAFSNGIIVLGAAAAAAYIALRGNTTALIPLYAIGVFASFTLSQFGMVNRWRRLREKALPDVAESGGRSMNWRVGMVINLVGGCMTAVVLMVTGATKFTEGGWVILAIIPGIVLAATSVHRHYAHAQTHQTPRLPLTPEQLVPVAVVPVTGLDPVTFEALALARRITDRVVAVHVSDDPERIAQLRRRWHAWGDHVPLEVVEAPYRGIVRPLLEFLDVLQRQDPRATLLVVLPELVFTRWWEQLLHNQTALRLKAALLFRSNTVVVSVPYHIRDAARS